LICLKLAHDSDQIHQVAAEFVVECGSGDRKCRHNTRRNGTPRRLRRDRRQRHRSRDPSRKFTPYFSGFLPPSAMAPALGDSLAPAASWKSTTGASRSAALSGKGASSWCFCQCADQLLSGLLRKEPFATHALKQPRGWVLGAADGVTNPLIPHNFSFQFYSLRTALLESRRDHDGSRHACFAALAYELRDVRDSVITTARPTTSGRDEMLG